VQKELHLFWKQHKYDTNCVHCGRSRYKKVVNEDGASITTKVVVKQIHCVPITPRLKRLYLSKEAAKQMMWHKEEKHDSEDFDIMFHLANGEA
jgi:hypothetical protein